MYRLSWANKARVEAAAVRANLRRPRAFWDDNLNACVSGYDNRDRRIRLSARTVIDLLGALKDAAARGGVLMMATALISSALLGLFCFVYWCCRAAWRGDAITDGEEYE